MPAYHFVVMPILLANIVVEVLRLNKYQTAYHVWMVVVAIALLLFGFTARAMALKAQDRVIRLEERLRLAALLPAAERAAIDNLTPGQLIALRFASDEEVPALVSACASGDLTTAGQVKKSIRTWRPDHLRV